MGDKVFQTGRVGSVSNLKSSIHDFGAGDSHERQNQPARESTPLLSGYDDHAASKEEGHHDKKRRTHSSSRQTDSSVKFGTFGGVLVPTTLNLISILMFLRFGFILGQSGIIGMIGMLVVCYIINLVTAMSISAIASNGTVRGGGAYYLISRSLGPEFGGSIGIVLYLGFVFQTGMNAVGIVDCFIYDFGVQDGNWYSWLPDTYWWRYLWASAVLALSTTICLAGSKLFARFNNVLFVIVLASTFSIPLSAIFKAPFQRSDLGIDYTGPSLQTLKENLLPHFTKNAAGSQAQGKESFQSLLGVLYSATGGITAGASMSGNLKNPNRSIPKGTLSGIALSLTAYALVALTMASCITRATFYRNLNVIEDVNVSGVVVLVGEVCTCLFSVLMGVVGSAKLLQALARDNLLPGLSIFGYGTKASDEPSFAIILTYIIAQLVMFADINRIASLVTMAYLMTFLVTNLACCLLKLSSAPNFRPSFRYFNSWTAALGTIGCGAAMFFIDGVSASACIAVLLILFVLIHYTTTPKSWGDVSQSLIYHQVRKYLLRLRQEHVKFWRPQILLLVNDPRRSYKLIQFCNSLKKGALFIIGHVIITNDFASAVPEAKKQHIAWTRYIDFSRIKGFINVIISPNIEWGTRNVVLSAGLGGMRPNIVIMGFYNLVEYRQTQSTPTPPPRASSERHHSGVKKPRKRGTHDARMEGDLPTDSNRAEKAVTASSYVTVLEDLLHRLKSNVAIAKGFNDLDLPGHPEGHIDGVMHTLHLNSSKADENGKKYIDLWPVQMSAELAVEGDGDPSILTSNFDTYTLILQLGCILHTVPSWKKAYVLRVAVFVEYEADVMEEQERVKALLSSLRIEAEVRVFWLASGSLSTYEVIVNGNTRDCGIDEMEEINKALGDEEWWTDIKEYRSSGQPLERQLSPDPAAAQFVQVPSMDLESMSPSGRRSSQVDLGRALDRRRRASSVSRLTRLGVSLTMQTQRLDPRLIESYPAAESSSSDDESDSQGGSSVEDTDNEEPDQEDESSSILFDSAVVSGATSSKSSRRSTLADQHDHERSRGSSEGDVSPRTQMEMEPSESRNMESKPMAEPEKPLQQNTPAFQEESAVPKALRIPSSGRPPFLRNLSQPKLSSALVPHTTVAQEDGPGPSIMFQTPSPPRRPGALAYQSIYDRHSKSDRGSPSRPKSQSSQSNGKLEASSSGPNASGFPLSASQSLSFNSLPCRAQHMILNELMRTCVAEEDMTAVIFTTLPAPVRGTSDTEEESLRYLADLETLCHGLPPVLMIHSNSMSVTTNL